MSWFQAFRSNYGFTYSSENRSSVTIDKPLVIVMYLCTLLSIATLIATLGIKGRERWSFVLRASYAVAIGSIIIACLVGHGWQTGMVRIRTGYIYRSNRPFEGYIGVNVALGGANVTLDGYYEGMAGRGYVYYSESIPWPDFGMESSRYSYFLERGLPDPILRVIAFITADEGRIAWGRSFHTSGYFTMVLLCTSLAFWIISNILLCSVVVYGAYMFLIAGFIMVLSCITYHVCQIPVSLSVRFNDNRMQLEYGWSFWLALVAGCVTFVLGIALVVADHFDHNSVADFFHLETQDKEEYQETNHTNDQALAALGASGTPERSSSIFQNVYRKPKTRGNSRRNGLLPGQSAFFIRSAEGNHRQSKMNQIHCDPDQIKCDRNADEQNAKCQLECLCEETEMTMVDAGISSSEVQEGVSDRMASSSSGEADNQHNNNNSNINNKNNNNEKHHREVRFQNNIFTIDLTQEDLQADSDSIYGNDLASSRDQEAITDDSPVNSLNEYMVSDDSDDSNHCGIGMTVAPDRDGRFIRESTTRNNDSLDSGIEVAHGFDSRHNRGRRNSVHSNGFNLGTIINIEDS